VDLDGDRGDPIVAANRGVVALVGDFYYSGNVAYVDHGEGLVTAYLHMSEVVISQGDTVETAPALGHAPRPCDDRSHERVGAGPLEFRDAAVTGHDRRAVAPQESG
jgi:septal ring factor EnvC (AmiA/AmiB activator)